MKRIIIAFLFSLLYLLSYPINETAKVLSYNTITHFDGNKVKSQIDCSIQINSRKDLDYCEVEIPFSGITEVKNIKAHISDLNGNALRKLKKKNIYVKSDISTGAFYEDDFVYYFSLKTDQFPAIFNYSYEIESEHFMFVEYWSPYAFNNIEIEAASLEVLLPKDLKFHLKLIKFDSVQPVLIDDYYSYKWDGKNFPIIKEENYMPPIKSILPSVVIVPYEFYFDHAGSFESWEKFGKWHTEMISGLDHLPPNEKAEIDEAIKNADTDLEKLEILYKRLQEETRYVNISEDVGGFKPHNASYVSQNKFGDCKALSNYFKAVLNYAGIQSYYSKIYSDSDNIPIDKSFPSQQFNHIILYVPLEKDSLWVDCTSDFQCGYVGTWIQNRNALLVNGDDSFFHKTPELTKEDVELSRIIYLKLTPARDTKIKVRNTYKGSGYESLYYIKNEFDREQKLEILNKYLIEDQMNTPDQFILQTSYNPPQIILDYTTYSSTIIQFMGNDIVVNIPDFSFPSLERPKYRDYDVQINYPIYYTDQITFEKPLNKKITFIPKDQEIDSDFGKYSLKVEETNHQITIYKSFYLNSGNYSLAQYDDFYNFIKESKKLDHKLLITTTK